jgi:aromatic-amino-acid transaminase
MRRLFVETLRGTGVDRDFSFIARQNGMFSFTGLTPEQVQRLRDDHAIYIVSSGRINVAGLNERTLPVVCKAVASVL